MGLRVEIKPENKPLLLNLARETIRQTLKRGRSDNAPPCPDPALLTPAGAFVSLHEAPSHRLRGCVGRMDASQPLWRCVHNAAVGVLADPRFADDVVVLGE